MKTTPELAQRLSEVSVKILLFALVLAALAVGAGSRAPRTASAQPAGQNLNPSSGSAKRPMPPADVAIWLDTFDTDPLVSSVNTLCRVRGMPKVGS